MTVALQERRPSLSYGDAIETEIAGLEETISAIPALAGRYRPRWLAVQLLEGDETLLQALPAETAGPLRRALAQSRRRLQAQYGDDVDIAIADRRYAWVKTLVDDVLTVSQEAAPTRSDRLDRLFTHKWLGIPILLALMYLVFNLVQTVSAPYLEWTDAVVSGPITRWAGAILLVVRAPEWLRALVSDGIIAGVGGVVVFLPGLMVMYFSLAFLEASGYMARAAFVMDRAMSVVGLQGQSFVPMILGFGCNVPAIYATRTIENRAARVLTGLLIPFMSCSARLPVYVIFGLAFFPGRANLVIWGLYVAGVFVAAAVGIVLSRTVFRQASPGTLVMEMPPYRWPRPAELWQYTWRQTRAFLRKAGTFILAVSVLFWVFMHLPWGVEEPQDSYFGAASQSLAPVFAPAGFGTWEASGALLTGILAKEAVVASLSQVYVGQAPEAASAAPPSLLDDAREIVAGLGRATAAAGRELLETLTPGVRLFAREAPEGETALARALQGAFTPLSALAFLAFVLLYVPCMATIGAQIQEFGLRWALLSAGIMLLVPWAVAVALYQGGRLLGLA